MGVLDLDDTVLIGMRALQSMDGMLRRNTWFFARRLGRRQRNRTVVQTSRTMQIVAKEESQFCHHRANRCRHHLVNDPLSNYYIVTTHQDWIPWGCRIFLIWMMRYRFDKCIERATRLFPTLRKTWRETNYCLYVNLIIIHYSVARAAIYENVFKGCVAGECWFNSWVISVDPKELLFGGWCDRSSGLFRWSIHFRRGAFPKSEVLGLMSLYERVIWKQLRKRIFEWPKINNTYLVDLGIVYSSSSFASSWQVRLHQSHFRVPNPRRRLKTTSQLQRAWFLFAQRHACRPWWPKAMKWSIRKLIETSCCCMHLHSSNSERFFVRERYRGSKLNWVKVFWYCRCNMAKWERLFF